MRRSKLGPWQRAALEAFERLDDFAGALLSSGRLARNIPKYMREALRAREQLNRSLASMKRRRLISMRDKGGETYITLTRDGKAEVLRYRFRAMKLAPQKRWDKKWHIVIFDIPERYGKARRALSYKVKTMGAYSLQRSVFVYPFAWRNEIDFVAEFFHVSPYVRYIVADEIEGEDELARHFKL